MITRRKQTDTKIDGANEARKHSKHRGYAIGTWQDPLCGTDAPRRGEPVEGTKRNRGGDS